MPSFRLDVYSELSFCYKEDILCITMKTWWIFFLNWRPGPEICGKYSSLCICKCTYFTFKMTQNTIEKEAQIRENLWNLSLCFFLNSCFRCSGFSWVFFWNSNLFNREHTKGPYLAYIKQMCLVSVFVTILLECFFRKAINNPLVMTCVQL